MSPILRNGNTAPEIDLRSVTGDPWRLNDRRGKMVILVFSRGEYCPTGRAEMVRWNSYSRLFPKMNGDVAVIVNGGPEQHARFAEAMRMSLPILVDEGGHVGQAYGLYEVNAEGRDYRGYTAPGCCLIDVDGCISASWILSAPRGMPSPDCLLGILGHAEHNEGHY